MPTDPSRSSLERLREYYEHQEVECANCGHRDEGGEWISETDGGKVYYRHECSQCETTTEYTVKPSQMEPDYGSDRDRSSWLLG